MAKHTPCSLFTVLTLLILENGCSSPDINNSQLRDRVRACGAGFSEDINLALNASFEELALKGGASGDFNDKAQSIIFSELPPQDRLKAYEDYIKCIQKDWNKEAPSKPSFKRKNPKL